MQSLQSLGKKRVKFRGKQGTYANQCSVEVTRWELQDHLLQPFLVLEVRSQKKEGEKCNV